MNKTKKPRKTLTENQKKVLELLTNGQGMSYTAIADATGVARKTIWRWLHEPQHAAFQQAYKDLNDEKWMVTVEAAREAALKLCMEGKADIVKFVLQNAGYNPTQKVEADVDVKAQVLFVDDMKDDTDQTE